MNCRTGCPCQTHILKSLHFQQSEWVQFNSRGTSVSKSLGQTSVWFGVGWEKPVITWQIHLIMLTNPSTILTNPRTNFEHSYADFKLTLHQHGLTEPLTRQSNDWIWFKQKPLFMFVGALVKLKIDCNLLKVHVGSWTRFFRLLPLGVTVTAWRLVRILFDRLSI